MEIFRRRWRRRGDLYHANYETRSKYDWMLLPDVSAHEYYLLSQYFTRRAKRRNRNDFLLIFLGKQRNFIGTVNIFILHRFYIGVGGSDRCLMSELKCRTNKRDEIVSPLTTRTSFPKLLLSNGRRTTSRDIKATGTSDGFSFTRDGLGNIEDSCTSTYATIENPCLNLLRIHSGVIGELVGIKLNFPYFQSMANIKLDVHNIWNAHALTHNYTRRNGCE